MFSSLPAHTHAHNQSRCYTPHQPSPLSSSPLRNSPSPLSTRKTNVPSRAPDTDMSSPTKPLSSPSNNQPGSISTFPFATPDTTSRKPLISPPTTKRESAYSRRTTKPNPLMSGRNGDGDRETRRKLFLKKVRDGSEDKRWKERGGDEEIMRCLWVAEERRREERRQREAMGIEGPLPEEEDEERMMTLDEIMAEEVAMSEEQELEALLQSMGSEDQVAMRDDVPPGEMDTLFGDRTSAQMPQCQQSLYGSDDDEYDDIFMNVIEEERRISSQQQMSGTQEDEEMMDLS